MKLEDLVASAAKMADAADENKAAIIKFIYSSNKLQKLLEEEMEEERQRQDVLHAEKSERERHANRMKRELLEEAVSANRKFDFDL